MGKQSTLNVLYKREVMARTKLEQELAQVRAQLAELQASGRNERLWSAFSTIPDAYAVFDRDDRLVFANEAYKQMYDGVRALTEPGCSRVDMLSAAIDAGILLTGSKTKQAWIKDITECAGPVGAAKSTVHTGDGRVYDLTSTRAPNGDLISYRRDITDEIARKQELEQAHFRANQATKAKSAVLASMSHEIRTPMNGVIGMADLMSDTQLDDEQRLYVDTIRSSGDSLLVIINDILDFSKIEAGQMELMAEPFNMEKVAHEACMLLRSKANEKGVDLLLDYDMFLPIWFHGDVGRIRQVLLNLISNAVKFTQTGHVSVHIVGIPQDDGAFEVHVAVEDTGIGIPKSKVGSVFDEFAQIDHKENRKLEGTGLGLAICKRLIEQMGGDIWVDSEAGVGSVFGFRVRLPCFKEEIVHPPAIPANIAQVVIVDDVEENRTILMKQLGSLGLNVIPYSSAEEALDAYDAGQQFDMVITDQLMPKMSGTEFGKSLRARDFKGLAVLLSSALPGRKTEHQGLSAFDSVLQKPALRMDLYKSLKLVFDAEASDTATHIPVISPLENRMLKILLAEDNKTNQLVFKKMLKSVGADLRIADNGVELLAMFKDERPDIVVTDISMPVMDGIVATRALRAYEVEQGLKPIPIVALTAHAMQGDKERFLSVGMDAYLSKPLKKDQVLKMIETYQSHATDDPFLDR